MTDFSPLDTFREPTDDDAARSRRIRDDFRRRIATMPPDAEGRRPFDPLPAPPTAPPIHRGRALALAGLALIVAITGVGITRLSSSPTTDGFDQLTAVAAGRPDESLAAGQYLHVTSRTTFGADETTHQQWTASDGTGQTLVHSLDLQAPGQPPALTRYSDPGSLAFAGLTYDQLRSLPAAPASLVERLRELGVITTDASRDEAAALAGVLALDVTPPDVAAAALQALERLGGIRIGPVPDAAGRVGEGIRGANGDGTTWMIVVDPRDGTTMAAHPRVDPAAPASRADGRVWIDQDVLGALPTP